LLNLSIALGAAQIVFGMCIKAANQIRQHGWAYALGTFGWLFMIVGSGAYFLLTSMGIQTPDSRILTLILSIGGILVLLFTDPKTGLISRVGQGVWNIYSTVTGVFGDLLSYIRLFALGFRAPFWGLSSRNCPRDAEDFTYYRACFLYHLSDSGTYHEYPDFVAQLVCPPYASHLCWFSRMPDLPRRKALQTFSNHPSG
jgi:hypothetical protein